MNLTISPYVMPGISKSRFSVYGKRLDKINKDKMLPSHMVIETVCEAIGFDIERIRLKTRKREVVEVRQMAMLFVYKYSHMPLAEVGWVFKKDHATVLHAIRTMKNLVETDKNIAAIHKVIDEKLNNKIKEVNKTAGNINN